MDRSRKVTDKVFVMGIDGMDPRYTKKMLDAGRMPNLKKFLERGAAREDLVLLGNHPTVTPPMWTTLSTGATPMVHGINGFFRTDFEVGMEYMCYNLTSTNCKAEQLWDVTAEAGLKTLVFDWPGASWPPTSINENLHVVDGSQPGAPGNGVTLVDDLFVLVADVKTEDILYRRRCASDTHIPCVISDLAPEPTHKSFLDSVNSTDEADPIAVSNGAFKSIVLTEHDGERGMSANPFDVELTPIKEAKGWHKEVGDAKEFVILFSGGLVRRLALIQKNADGVYNKIELYKSKKDTTPYAILEKDVYTEAIVDTAIKNDKTYNVTRDMRVLELAEDGTHVKMYISVAQDIDNDIMWYPNRLYKSTINAAGYMPAIAQVGGGDEDLIAKCGRESWRKMGYWYARALKHLIKEEDYQVIFSHYHNIDSQGHMLVKWLKGESAGNTALPPEKINELFEMTYEQTDEYIGLYLDMLDDDWTILIVSDHGQICGPYEPPMLGDSGGVDIGVMRELGYTEVIKDADGNDTYNIDWSKTRAISKMANNIYINLKGRSKYGIVDPEDKYELEEQIITDLYGYKHPITGKRIVSLALRQKDAAVLGMGGEDAGDIIFMLAEGYNFDHVDSLSTTYGLFDTSVSPLFAAAGPGIKHGYTDRHIREVDVAPTIAELLDVRKPAQCEGAPAYQIIDYK